MSTKPPFSTSDEALALSLLCAGFRQAHFQNAYTPEKLAQLGCKSISEARQKRRFGVTTWVFENSPELDTALAAWNAQGEDARNGEPVTVESLTMEDAMRMFRMFAWNRGKIRDAIFRSKAATLLEIREGKPRMEEHGEGRATLHCPGVIYASENLSQEKREKLGI